LVLIAGDRLAVCFAAPVVEVLDAAQERNHPALRGLGPDVLASELPDLAEVQRRARIRAGAAPTVGELLLDQQFVAGIGNIYRCEALFLCQVHPATPVGSLASPLLGQLVATASRLMKASADPATHGGRRFAPEAPSAPGAAWVYRRAGRPCRRRDPGSPQHSRSPAPLGVLVPGLPAGTAPGSRALTRSRP
jgi:endonuclease-8